MTRSGLKSRKNSTNFCEKEAIVRITNKIILMILRKFERTATSGVAVVLLSLGNIACGSIFHGGCNEKKTHSCFAVRVVGAFSYACKHFCRNIHNKRRHHKQRFSANRRLRWKRRSHLGKEVRERRLLDCSRQR